MTTSRKEKGEDSDLSLLSRLDLYLIINCSFFKARLSKSCAIRMTSFVRSLLEEVNQRQCEISAAREIAEKLRQREQLLTDEIEKFRVSPIPVCLMTVSGSRCDLKKHTLGLVTSSKIHFTCPC